MALANIAPLRPTAARTLKAARCARQKPRMSRSLAVETLLVSQVISIRVECSVSHPSTLERCAVANPWNGSIEASPRFVKSAS
jgi:hypothetical protein